MEITYDDFKQCCPAGEVPDSDIFDSVGAQIQRWKDWARELATPDIYDSLDKLDAEPVTEDYDRHVALRRFLVGMVCSFAFEDAIPQLDLVLTHTGFGVVSNQNVAPASQDRVNALKTQLHKQGNIYLEEALDVLRHLGVPMKSKLCSRFFLTFFWKAEHLHVFGIPNPTRDDLATKIPKILEAQSFVSTAISPAQVQALLDAQASGTATSVQNIAIGMCRVLCVYRTGQNVRLIQVQRLALLNFMEEYLDDFPEYRDSETYKANHFQRYENQKDDPCFFFG